jgi:hypothetical protein
MLLPGAPGCVDRDYGPNGSQQGRATPCITDADCTGGASCDVTEQVCVGGSSMVTPIPIPACTGVPDSCRPCIMNNYILDAWHSLDCPTDMVCDAAAGCCVLRPGCDLPGTACTSSDTCCSGQCRDGICQKNPNGYSCQTNDDCYDGNCSALGVCQIGGQVCIPAEPGGMPSCESEGCTPDFEPGGGGDCCSGTANQDGFCVTLGSRAARLPCSEDTQCRSLRCGPDCTCLPTQSGLHWPDGMECNYGEECAGGLCDLDARCRSSCAAVGAACSDDVDCCGGMCGAAGLCVSLSCAAGDAGTPCDLATDCCSGECGGGACEGPTCREASRTCTRDEQCCGGTCDGAPEVGRCN